MGTVSSCLGCGKRGVFEGFSMEAMCYCPDCIRAGNTRQARGRAQRKGAKFREEDLKETMDVLKWAFGGFAKKDAKTPETIAFLGKALKSLPQSAKGDFSWATEDESGSKSDTEASEPETDMKAKKEELALAVRTMRLRVGTLVLELPETHSATVAEILAQHEELDTRISNAKSAFEQLAAVKKEHDAAAAQVEQARQQKSARSLELDEQSATLGQAAGKAWESGSIADTNHLAPIMDLVTEIRRLEKRSADLDGATGFLAVTKAKAEQLAIQGQIGIVGMKRGKAERAVGKALLDSEDEGLVQCSATDGVLARVAELRSAMVEADHAVQEANDHLAAGLARWADQLSCDTLDSTSLLKMYGAVETEVKSAQGALKTFLQSGVSDTVLKADIGDFAQEGDELHEQIILLGQCIELQDQLG